MKVCDYSFINNNSLIWKHIALKIEWCKARARYERWEEEVILLVEEMRRVQEYARWKADWWMSRVDLRFAVSTELREGTRAYAEEHAERELNRVSRLERAWGGLSVLAENVLAKRSPEAPIQVELDEEEPNPEQLD